MAGRPAPLWRSTLKEAVMRSGTILAALAIALAALLYCIALISYHQADPALNTVTGTEAKNWLGTPGAWLADILLSVFGPPALLITPFIMLVAWRLWCVRPHPRWTWRCVQVIFGISLIDIAMAELHHGSFSGLPAGLGGGIGVIGASIVDSFATLLPAPLQTTGVLTLGLVSAVGGVILWALGLELDAHDFQWSRRAPKNVALQNASKQIRKTSSNGQDAASFARSPSVSIETPTPQAKKSRPIIADPKSNAAPTTSKAAQTSLDLRDTYTLPPLSLLTPPPASTKVVIDKSALERNARLLETVLSDFHVKGVITEVRPGPVVTMYELEPASGIKASRVIQLADDIARNMSALSARVATVPGRTVIGIELPNARRESVMLHEMVASQAFADNNGQLPIILGKNISGEPVIADLAPMPHLLVAGTTGSGKSVGLNAMIVSLLYRLTPEQCKMIMIDPKMLELSIYDDIPHLLSPVVTEPAKAIRALKWAVEQMEDRYRMMASLSVRSLAGYNDKVRAARAKGQALGRRVQTGYDADTGQPIYEEEKLDYQTLPQIVVIVDELADLMMTAGKEVEFLIQRLAQKARAAGIHLIMATQRPSVDVITGVIKANLPTRISFAVTSKIDSRTILGDQGAEQLLGKGDMLYMPGGKQIARVHGPFVSDEEVRSIADHWRGQGQPDYISAVTEEPAEGDWAMDGAPSGEDSAEDQLYRKAVQIVAESQKASTSYIQRQLRIGYNSAARLIERMENQGLVGRPDHVGRREVLMDTEGHAI